MLQVPFTVGRPAGPPMGLGKTYLPCDIWPPSPVLGPECPNYGGTSGRRTLSRVLRTLFTVGHPATPRAKQWVPWATAHLWSRWFRKTRTHWCARKALYNGRAQ